MPRIAYVNGMYVPHQDGAVHIEDRGFQFADSIYEVVALIDGKFADERGHLDRLERSLHEIRIDMPMSRKALQIVMRETVRRNKIKNGALYLQVTRGQAARDFKFPKDIAPSLVMTMRPVTYDMAARKEVAKKAVTVPDIRWKRRDIKSTALLAQVLAKQAAVDKGAFEAWMVDDAGFVTEASSSNAWIVDKKGNLITRQAVGNTILKGVTRSALQTLCKQKNIKIIERPFTVKEAYAASEAFTTAATALVVPIVEIDGKKIGSGKIGPISSAILDLYFDYATDPKRKHQSWNEK